MANPTEPTDESSKLQALRVTPLSPREALTPEPAPPRPPKRAKHKRHPIVGFLNGLITFCVLLILALGASLYVGKSWFEDQGPLKDDTAVLIPAESGVGVRRIADLLTENGVIANPYLFMAGAVAYRKATELKAGEYAFKAGMSMHAVLDLIVSGRGILHSITIPEGLTSQQIIQRISEDDMLSGTLTTIPAEGSLLPETYKFSRRTARSEIVNRMQSAMKDALEEIWKRHRPGLPLKSPQELLTLASIVEKETGIADERPRVAAVFINRLTKGMRLQSDPTIIYGIVGGAASLGRALKKSEIESITPYNTYQIDGLPPGPIANPGRASLEAVANPSNTRELYFVADGSGGHAFAATLEEHNRNVRHWRELTNAPAEPDEPPALRTDPPTDGQTGSLLPDDQDPLGVSEPAFRNRPQEQQGQPVPKPDMP